MNQTARELVSIMFDAAQLRWPSLTWEEFQEIGLAIIVEQGDISINDLSLRLETQLLERFGPDIGGR